MRVYLTGDLAVESGGRVASAGGLTLQGRLVLAMLAAEHRRVVLAEELAEELWGDSPSAAWGAGLRALVSKVRAALGPVTASMAGGATALIVSEAGGYRFRLPADGQVDIDEAQAAIHEAEARLAAGEGEVEAAGASALVASMIARRAFLVGLDGPWVATQRARLLDARVRALEVLGRVWSAKGDHAQAARDAREAVRLDPFRETAYQLLMEAQAAAGNPALAAAAFRECERVLRAELGVGPSAATVGVYRAVRGGQVG